MKTTNYKLQNKLDKLDKLIKAHSKRLFTKTKFPIALMFFILIILLSYIDIYPHKYWLFFDFVNDSLLPIFMLCILVSFIMFLIKKKNNNKISAFSEISKISKLMNKHYKLLSCNKKKSKSIKEQLYKIENILEHQSSILENIQSTLIKREQ